MSHFSRWLAPWLFATSSYAATFEPIPNVVPHPKDNAPSLTKISLGKQLFFDPRISARGETSCFSCHNIMGSGENNLAASTKPDGKPSRHSVPTVWNAAFQTKYFWTGGAQSLEEQAEGPLEEMGLGDTETVVAKIRAIPGYVTQFRDVFGSEVSLKSLTQALAAFERTLVTRNSPFDRYLKGDTTALSSEGRAGFSAFQKLGCASCHQGVNLAGTADTALQRFPQFPHVVDEAKYHVSEDLGLFNDTQREADKNIWRVPTLRNVAETAPYFHNGSVPTLEEAVRVMARGQLNKDLSEKETRELVVFLRSLTGVRPRMLMPELP